MKRIFVLSFICILLFSIKSFSYSVPAWAWTHNFNGTVRAVEYAGNYYYTAGTYSDSAFVFDNTTLPNNGSKDIFIAKWDSLGNMLWAKSLWGSAYDSVVSIKVNNNNELIINGSTNSGVLHADAITVNSNGGYDMFIAKYDLNGNALNAYIYGTGGNEYSIDMCVDHLNNIYLASANKLTQYNNSGVQVWQKSLTATQGNYVEHVIYSSFDSTVILTGTYAGSFTLNAVTLTTTFMLSWNYWPQKIYYAKINPNSNLVWLKDDATPGHAQHTPNIFAKASNGYIYTAYQQFGGLGGTYYAFREQLPNGNMTNATFGGLPVEGQGYDNDAISIIAVSGNASYVSVSTTNSFYGQTLLIYNVVNHTVEKIYNVYTKSPHIFRHMNAIYTPSIMPDYSWGKISHDSLLGSPTYQSVNVCNGNTQTLTGNISGGEGTLSYSWLPVTGLNNTNTNTVTFTAISNISYTLTVTDGIGQVAKDTFNIVVQSPLPQPNISGQFPAICDSMELNSNNGIPGTWQKYDFAYYGYYYWYWQSVAANTTNPTIYSAGTYRYITSNACGSVADTLDVTGVVTVNATASDDTLCAGQSLTLTGSGGAVNYAWTGGVQNNVPFTVGAFSTAYIVTGTDANGCSNTSYTAIIVNPTSNTNTNLSVCANQTPYNWNGQNLDSSGVYTANYTNIYGCDSIATLNLTVSPCIVCVPNFTINYSPFYNSLTESQTWIKTSGTVLILSGDNVKLDANTNSYVMLNPGFKADSGSVFVAQAYNGCTAGAPQLPQEKQIEIPDLFAGNEIVLYPNPTSGLIHIKHDEKLTGIQIFDMVGKLIINQKCAGETETNIDLSNLPNGVYHVKAAGYNSIKVVKNN